MKYELIAHVLGTQFTRFTNTKVHILTQEAVLNSSQSTYASIAPQCYVLTLLALLVQKYTY
jgi:hypothetical protein